MRVHMDAEPRHLTPLAAPSRWAVRVTMDTVFETLVRYEPPDEGPGRGPGSYAPGLAASWRVYAGGREMRLELRDGVTFHDGSRMSAVDVQFSIDSARSARVDAPHLRWMLRDVTSVEIVSARAVRIRLSKPNGYVLRALAALPIVPEHVYRKKLVPRKGPVIGTGPYRLAEWKGGRIILSRYAEYWGEPPAISTIAFIHDPDAASAVTAAKRGEIDIIPELIAAHVGTQLDAPAVVARFTTLRLRPAAMRYLVLGHSSPLDDVRVRQAISLLVDRHSLVAKARGRVARPVTGPVWPGGPGDARAPEPVATDAAQAAALLDEAGWLIEDGVRRKDGERLHVAMLALPGGEENDDRDRIATALTEAGFFVEVRRGSSGVLMNRLETGEFDLALLEWDAMVDVDLAPLVGTRGRLNYGRYADSDTDALLDRLHAAESPAARRPIVAELGAHLARTVPFVALSAPDPRGLMHRRVRGAVVWNGWIALRRLSLAHEDEAE